MTPTHRLNIAELERIAKDPATCRSFVRQARAHRRSANTIQDDDPEGAFQLAFDGCRKVALAVVQATGVRPKGTAHHEVTFDAAAALVAQHREGPVASDLKRSLDDATDLRKVRADAEYRAVSVEDATVSDAIEILDELLSRLPALVEELLGT